MSDSSTHPAVGNSPYLTWGERATASLFEKTSLRSAGGEQVLFCRVHYDPGAEVPAHSHDETEQLMWVLDGEIEMTVAGERRTLHPDDVVVINRGVEHSLTSATGCEFLEALSPVPRDHVADPERDLVLGADGDSRHVDR